MALKAWRTLVQRQHVANQVVAATAQRALASALSLWLTEAATVARLRQAREAIERGRQARLLKRWR
jgi:hypothetical protein